MTSEELRELASTLNAGNHAGTVDDPIPQQLLYTKTSEDGTKKVYTVAAGIAVGGSGAPADVKHATDTVVGIVKLTDDPETDAPAATGYTALTPNGAKVAIETAIDDALADGGKLDNAIDDAIQDKIDSGEIGGGGDSSSSLVVKPDIIAPLEGAQNVSVMVQLQASAYKCLLGESEQRKHREFEIATVAEPSETKFTKEINADTVSVDSQLDPQTQFKWRCRDVTVNGLRSAWTSWTTFTTGNAIQVDTPTVTCTEGTTDVPETPTFTASAFAITPDQGNTSSQHQSTTWRLLDVGDSNAQVWQSENDTTNKTSITLARGTMQAAKTYIMQAIYNSVSYGSSAAGSVQFTTATEFTHVAQPTLTCSDGTSDVMETPTIVGSAFTVEPSGSDTHTWTTWNVLQNGTTSVYKLEQSSSALTTLNIPSGVLKVSQSYTVTCVYNGATYGESDVGQVTFTTAAVFTGPRAPVITVSPSAENFLATGTIKAEPQYNNGDYEPDKAEWEIMLAAGGAAIYQSGEVTTYAGMRMLYAPFGSAKLAAGTAYKVRCRQHYAGNEQGGTWSPWAELNFTTSQDYASTPEWGRIHFKVGRGGGTFKQSDFRWWDTGKLQVMINGAPNSEATINLNENDDVIIYNVLDKNYPDVWFKPMNPKEILEPLPLLTMKASGTPVTDFGGDVGVEQTGSNRNTSTDKYGLFAQCSNLTTLCDGLFRNNPLVYCLGAMGGGGTGGAGGRGDSAGIAGKGADGGAGGGSIANNVNIRRGNGCFSSTGLIKINEDLLSYFTNAEILFLGGYGGGGGGGGGGGEDLDGNDGYAGATAVGCFYDLLTNVDVPSNFFAAFKNRKVDIFGAEGGKGGDGGNGGQMHTDGGTGGAGGGGTNWGNKFTSVGNIFNGVILVHNSVGYGGMVAASGPNSCGGGGGGGGGGYYGGGGGGGGGGRNGEKPTAGIAGVSGGKGGGKGGDGGGHADILGGGGGYGCGPYNANPSSKVDYSSQYGAFAGCTELTEVPEDLFGDLTIESLCNTFKGCTKLASVPQNLLANVNVKLVNNFFAGCTALQNGDVRIKYNNVLNAENFSTSTPTKTIVRVPAGSTTATTFQNDATANTNVVLESV